MVALKPESNDKKAFLKEGTYWWMLDERIVVRILEPEALEEPDDPDPECNCVYCQTCRNEIANPVSAAPRAPSWWIGLVVYDADFKSEVPRKTLVSVFDKLEPFDAALLGRAYARVVDLSKEMQKHWASET